ncbi:IRE (iron responsive element) [Roseimaritima sediminicola]|uniref:IRE (iron responsive element) n=1 Tax=Roseimaritima sediminicola TaxID=2662066 RepID=UPI00129854C9|nr:IRE (iron responsive element) [Roseimaritima sediminicola]
MNLSHGLTNKLVYLAILILMLIPLFLLGQPSSGGGERSGGQLTQMRDDFDISVADLGEINPASETMKLSTLGLRGPAVTLLWNKAHDQQVAHQWDRYRATLNNISLLQPHFEKVWEFQAHNLSYNISAQFDDYRQRYAWVTGGTEYLSKGVRQNRKAPALVWHTGWYYGQKLGMSDEKKEFRELFRDDKPLHERIRAEGIDMDSNETLGPDRKPDNWLVGRQWLQRGYRMTREGGIPLRRKTPLHFYETGPKWLFNYAIAIEREGELSDAAQRAWQNASSGWDEYSQLTIPTTAEFTIRLGELEELRRKIEEQEAEFETLTGGLKEKIRAERLADLGDEQKKLMAIPAEERNERQNLEVADLQRNITPSAMEVAQSMPREKKVEALELADAITLSKRRLDKVVGYRQQVNFDYWATRAAAEQTDEMLEARRLVYEAEQLMDEAKLDQAIEKYDQAWGKWAAVFDEYPLLTFDNSSDDLMDSLERYQEAIDSEEFGEDFPLKEFVAMRESGAMDVEHYHQLVQEQRDRNAEQDGRDKVLDLDFQQMMLEAQKSNQTAEGDEAAEDEAAAESDEAVEGEAAAEGETAAEGEAAAEEEAPAPMESEPAEADEADEAEADEPADADEAAEAGEPDESAEDEGEPEVEEVEAAEQ